MFLFLDLNYLLLDWNYMVQCCGTVFVFKMFISNPGTIRLQIWREDTTNGEYVLRAEKVYTFSLGKNYGDLLQSIRVN